jgi:hypothetical protein
MCGIQNVIELADIQRGGFFAKDMLSGFQRSDG